MQSKQYYWAEWGRDVDVSPLGPQGTEVKKQKQKLRVQQSRFSPLSCYRVSAVNLTLLRYAGVLTM